jgi:hypothetical protein
VGAGIVACCVTADVVGGMGMDRSDATPASPDIGVHWLHEQTACKSDRAGVVQESIESTGGSSSTDTKCKRDGNERKLFQCARISLAVSNNAAGSGATGQNSRAGHQSELRFSRAMVDGSVHAPAIEAVACARLGGEDSATDSAAIGATIISAGA